MTLNAAATVSANASDIAGDGTARTFSYIASDILESAKGVRVNAQIALAISQRVDGMVEAISLLEDQSLVVDAQTSGSLAAFQRVLLDIKHELHGLRKSSYLSQLLNFQNNKDKMIRLSESLRHAFQVLMVQLRIKTSVMAQTLETQLDALAATSAVEFGLPASMYEMSAAHLPPNPSLHFGRDSETAAVLDAMMGVSAGRVAILGGPGIGKTSLALAVLHHHSVVERFGARRFFVPCDAAEGHPSCLPTIAEAFGITSSDARRIFRQLRDILSGAPAVVVLDNFESAWESSATRQDAERVLHFLDSFEKLSLVLTLRGAERPHHVRWTQPFLPPLSPLSAVAAKQTFHSIAELSDADAALDALLSRLDNIPLAIVLMANLAQAESAESLLRKWDTLETAMLVRGSANDRSSSLDVSITLSLQSPRMQSVPTAQQLLSLLSLLPCGVVDCDIDLWNISDTAHALAALFQNSLVLRSVDNRIYVLAPVRSFMLAKHRPSEASAAPVCDHYFGLAQLAEQFILAPSHSNVLAVVAPELANIDAVVRYVLSGSGQVGPRSAAVKAVSSLCTLYKHCGMGSGVELLPTAIRTARELQLEEHRAELLIRWASISADQTIPGDPRTLLAEAREIYERLGDGDGVFGCSIRLANYLSPDQGVLESRRLYALLSPRGDSLLLARCVMMLADCLERDGKPRDAVAQYEETIGIMQRAFGPDVQHYVVGLCMYHMARTLKILCDLRRAIALLQEALSIFDATSYAQGIVAVRLQLGDLLSIMGKPQQAVRLAEQVLAADIPGAGSFRVYAQCLVNSALSRVQTDDADAVEAALDKAERLALSRETIPIFQCQALAIRAHLALQRGDCAEARLALAAARTIARRLFFVAREAQNAPAADVQCVSSLSEVECVAGRRDEAAILIVCAAIGFRARDDILNTARCLPRLAEAVEDDEFAERIVEAALLPMQWMGLGYETAILLLRSATIARNRGMHALARHRARNALRHFGEIKSDWRLGLARELADVESQ